jgi:probable HAF family extracellular repeat protein
VQHLRIATLLLFGMVVFGGVQTAMADVQYSFTPIDVPGGFFTTAWGINNSGQIVGFYDTLPPPGLVFRGFLDTDGTFSTMDLAAFGINDSGQIAAGSGVLNADGSFTPINVPGASSTTAFGINNSGQIVGSYEDFDECGPLHGFLYSDGSFTTIDVPGGSFTQAFGINDSGQIVEYTGYTNSFLATPTVIPEPRTLPRGGSPTPPDRTERVR